VPCRRALKVSCIRQLKEPCRRALKVHCRRALTVPCSRAMKVPCRRALKVSHLQGYMCCVCEYIQIGAHFLLNVQITSDIWLYNYCRKCIQMIVVACVKFQQSGDGMLNFLSLSLVLLQTYQPHSCGLKDRMIGVVMFRTTNFNAQINCHTAVIQLSRSCHTVVMQLSSNCQLSCSCHAVVIQLSSVVICMMYAYFPILISRCQH